MKTKIFTLVILCFIITGLSAQRTIFDIDLTTGSAGAELLLEAHGQKAGVFKQKAIELFLMRVII